MGKSNKLPYKVTPSKDSKQVTIAISGNLSLDSVDSVKLMLIKNLNQFQVFNFKVIDVENIDLGIVQLLYSFKASAERKSKSISFEFFLKEDHKQLLEHAGFTELVNGNQI